MAGELYLLLSVTSCEPHNKVNFYPFKQAPISVGSREKILNSSYLYKNSLPIGSSSLYTRGEANIPLEFFQQQFM